MSMSADLTLKRIYSMSDRVATAYLQALRWPETVTCVECNSDDVCRMETRGIFKCYNCYKQFSETSSSMLAGRKANRQDVIAAAFMFCASVKGVSSLQASRVIGNGQKVMWILHHKFREAIEREVNSLTLDGIVEIDGGTFGGHHRHANVAQDFSGSFKRYGVKNKNQTRVIVIAKKRGGRTVPFVGLKESDALPHLCRLLSPNTIIQADGAKAWDGLAKLFEMMRIEHKYSFASNMSCTNNAESFFSQMRKLHSGTHHKIHGKYMNLYACEAAWKRDFARLTQKDRTEALLKLCLSTPKSERFTGVWQGALKEAA